MTTDDHIQSALTRFLKAKRIAVQNFCWSAPSDADSNRANVRLDARLYSWNSHTVKAIEQVLKAEGKL